MRMFPTQVVISSNIVRVADLFIKHGSENLIGNKNNGLLLFTTVNSSLLCMNGMKTTLFNLVVSILTAGSIYCFESKEGSSLLRVCYYTDFVPPPSQLNTTLCTHIIAGFSRITDGLINVGNDTFKDFYRQTTRLKKCNPDLKVLLTIGGGGGDNGFSPAVGSLQNRTRFIASALTILNDFNFDGLDIDWEFPVWNDYILEDKENFVSFLKEFKLGAALFRSMTGKNLLLSVAVAAPQTIVDKAYNIPEMAKYVDFINLMTYDFHDYLWYTPFTDHNSPLFNRSVERAYFATLNTAWAAFYWNQLGMPKNKIMVGIPTYGHTYKLVDPKNNEVDAPASGIGMNGGDITFTQVCQFLSCGASRVFDNESQVPYAYKDYDWVSYEDQTSMLRKALWIKEQGFGGAMTFNLNSDDWSSACNSVPFPLHNILYQVFTG